MLLFFISLMKLNICVCVACVRVSVRECVRLYVCIVCVVCVCVGGCVCVWVGVS